MRTSKKVFVTAMVTALAAITAIPAGAANANGAGGDATYTITITNETDGQPFTPALVATHRGSTDLFDVGSAANIGIQEIAENGNLGPAIDILSGDRHVSDWGVFMGDGHPPVLPGETISFTLQSDPGARQLTWASMLICTNDGFTGLDSVDLPKKVGDSVTLHTAAYDAGTEINTEDFSDIVPPCQAIVVDGGEMGTGTTNPALAENGVIHHHAGIVGGVDDLTVDDHGWTGAVATVTVERTG